MKLSEVLKTIPALPWGLTINQSTGNVKTVLTGKIELSHDEANRFKESVYMIHCANRLPKLVEALRKCQAALKDHVQYDNPEEEPSLEAEGFNAACSALADAEEVKGI